MALTPVVPERARIMRAVKSRDTGPEMRVRRLLHSLGYRYRLHRQDLPGKPDIVFPNQHKAIFVHGCFWHGHDCPRGARLPKTNRTYWETKIARNRERDEQHLTGLQRQDWRALIVWECELKDTDRLRERLIAYLAR